MRIIAATSMTVFSLTAVFVATSAWFTASRKVDGNGDGFIAALPSGIVKKVEFFTMNTDYDKSSGSTFTNPVCTYNTTASVAYTLDGSTKNYTTKSQTASIGQYDITDFDYSMMVLFTLRDDASENDYNFTMKAVTSLTEDSFSKSVIGINGTMTSNKDDDKKVISDETSADNGKTQHYYGNLSLSDVIQFKAYFFTDASDLTKTKISYTSGSETKTKEVYDFSDKKTEIQDKADTFIAIENNTASLSKTTINLHKNTSKINSIAVILSYNKKAITKIYNKYLGNKILSNSLTFGDIDFKLVI